MRENEDFPADPVSVGAARRFVARCLPQVDRDVLDTVLVMVSELAANSVRHALSRFRVDLEWNDESVRVAVTDWGSGSPSMRSPTPSEPSGRGLRIVDALADQWGIDTGAGTKAVWFRVGLGGPPARA